MPSRTQTRKSSRGKYLDTSAANFQKSLMISCYSFTDLCRRAAPLMTAGGSLLTLTYVGAERVTPHYNVMGVAKAALDDDRYLAVDLGGPASGSTPSPPARSGRSRPRASATFATF